MKMNSLTPTVVRIRRKDGIIIQDCDLYIGRRCTQAGYNLQESKWANPFPVLKYGIDQSLLLYREYIIKRIDENPVLYNLSELQCKTLGCWCGTGRNVQCHGNVLIDIMKERNLC